MTSFLTTLSLIIALGIAIETTVLSGDVSGSVTICSDPVGTQPPPPSH